MPCGDPGRAPGPEIHQSRGGCRGKVAPAGRPGSGGRGRSTHRGREVDGQRGPPPGAPRAWQGPGGGTGSFFVERDFERRLRKEPGRPTTPETDQRPVTAGISGARAKGGERSRPCAPPGVPLRGRCLELSIQEVAGRGSEPGEHLQKLQTITNCSARRGRSPGVFRGAGIRSEFRIYASLECQRRGKSSTCGQVPRSKSEARNPLRGTSLVVVPLQTSSPS